MNCYFCHDSFLKANSLITHLKILHKCEDSKHYFCGQEQCHRHFSNLNSFRKHLRTHQNTPQNSCLNLARNCEKKCLTSEQSQPRVTNLCADDSVPVQDSQLIPEKLFENFKAALKKKYIIFCCSLYSEPNICRKNVQKIIESVQNLLLEPLHLFKNSIHLVPAIADENKFYLNKYFEEFENLFAGLESEYLRFKYLEQSGVFIKPIGFVVGQRLEKHSKFVPIPKNYVAQYIPMIPVLQKFFEQPNTLFETLKYIEEIKEKSAIYNVMQTDYWKEKMINFKTDDIVLPLFIYYDDFESGNPLGSHSGIHKIGAVYYSVSCLPPRFQSRLDNIFMVMLFHSADLKQFGEKVLFTKLVNELNVLKNDGVILHLISGETVKIHFCIALFIGDNLGLNTLLGFQESFSAHSFCRFCKCLRAETKEMCTEVYSSLRNRENYVADLQANNVSATGIKFSPVVNNIELFHVTENYSVDIAHDIFEGVGVKVMSNLLYQFVIVDKFFEIETLNNKIRFFDFGANHNKPPVIALESLKKKIIRMSASEMKSFIVNAGLLFGYLIPEGNKHWQLYIFLRKILRIVLGEYVVPHMLLELRNLIMQHHSLFLELFNSLSPKFHLMTHYPLVMEKVGPLSKITTLRYESKHRISKLAANVISSRVNITYSLALKHQLQLASRFASNTALFENKICFSHTKIKNKSLEEILPRFKNMMLDIEKFKSDAARNSFQENISEVYRLSYNNKIFREKDVIVLKKQDSPCFGSIKTMIVNEKEDICIIYNELKIKIFNEHLFAYEICPTINTNCIFLRESCLLETSTVIKRNNHMFVTIS